MPSGSLVAAYPLVKSVLSQEPRSVLDVGMGTGKWGFLLREQTDLANNRPRDQWRMKLVGIEAYEPYIGEHQRTVYDEIVVAEAAEYLAAYSGDRFDAALLLDVIEHFEPEAAVAIVRDALRVARLLYVATPRRFRLQEGMRNDFERHLSWWPPAKLLELASRVEAHVSVQKYPLKTVAVFSADAPIPRARSRERLSRLRWAIVPDRLYFRVRGGTGPTI